MKKSTLTLLILTILFLCFSSVETIAEDNQDEIISSGDYQYIILPDNTVSIIQIMRYGGKHYWLTIPEMIDGHVVSSLADNSIHDAVFTEECHITKVTIPNNVIGIEGNPFRSCGKLKEIDVSPDHPTLAIIDGVLFSKADKRLICYPRALSGVTYSIPQGIRLIGNGAFDRCPNLKSIIIPDTVTAIGDEAFRNCIKLEDVSVSDKITSIGNGAFFNCSSLKNLVFPDGLTIIEDSVCSSCDSLTSITIPDSVITIGNSAFAGCEKLTDILIPDGVTSIGKEAFRWCKSLTNVIIPGHVKIIEDSVFDHCERLASITLPDCVMAIGNGSFSDCGLTEVRIPNNVEIIGRGAFFSCYRLASVIIPDSVKNIEEYAFYNCWKDLKFTVTRDSYAEQYCLNNSLQYVYSDGSPTQATPDPNAWLND